MSYLVVGLAIAVMLALKCFLMKRNITRTTQRFINPRSFSEQLLEAQVKKLGIDGVKQDLNPEKLITIIRKNTNDLKNTTPGVDQKLNIQRLRNICLCIELLQNPQISQQNNFMNQIKTLNRSLLQSWDSWLSANKNSPGLQGETSKYLLYLAKHFA